MNYYKRHLGDYAKKTSSWISLDFIENKLRLPVVACCYVIYFDGELKYIGSTNNLRNRFSGHAFRYSYAQAFITPWGEYEFPFQMTIKFKPSTRYGDWLMLEARMIRRIQPEFNKKLKGRARNV